MLKVGLIGSGRKAEQQLELLIKSPDIQIVGITDESHPDARRLALEFQIPFFEELEDLIRISDILNITCSGEYAYSTGIAAVRNFRHVYLHSGLSWRLAELRMLSNLSSEAGVKVCIHNLKRTNRTFLAARKFAHNPQFTEINLAESGSPGSEEALSFRLAQCIDLLLAVNRNPIKRIHAHAVPMKDQSIGFIQSRIEFNNGSVATISYSRINGKPTDLLSTYSEEGSLKVDFLNSIASFIPYPCTARLTVTGDAIPELNVSEALRHMLSPTRSGQVLSSIDDLLLPQEITHKILEKAGIHMLSY
jgi:predicted dehydrogenase